MKTLTKLLIGAGFTIAGALGTSYSAKAQYTDELYWKQHKKLPSSNQTNYNQNENETKRQTKKKIKKANNTNDWLNNHTHEFSYGNENQNTKPFTYRTDNMFGTEYVWDNEAKKTYLTPKTETSVVLSNNGDKKLAWIKKYQLKELKNKYNQLITKIRANDIKINPTQSSGIYNENDYARNYKTHNLNGVEYVPLEISKEEIKKITGDSKEEVLPILLIPYNSFFKDSISNQNGDLILINTKGVLYATTKFDEISTSSQAIIITQKIDYKKVEDSILKSKNDSSVVKSLDKNPARDYWVVGKGDTPYSIAQKTKTPLDSLVKWNNIREVIKKGDKLKTNPHIYYPRDKLRNKK